MCKAGAGLFDNYLTIDSKGCFEAATLNLAPFVQYLSLSFPLKRPEIYTPLNGIDFCSAHVCTSNPCVSKAVAVGRTNVHSQYTDTQYN